MELLHRSKGCIVYRCPWCERGFVRISGDQPQGSFVLEEKCSYSKCGKPYRIVFPEGRVEKGIAIPHNDLVA